MLFNDLFPEEFSIFSSIMKNQIRSIDIMEGACLKYLPSFIIS